MIVISEIAALLLLLLSGLFIAAAIVVSQLNGIRQDLRAMVAPPAAAPPESIAAGEAVGPRILKCPRCTDEVVEGAHCRCGWF